MNSSFQNTARKIHALSFPTAVAACSVRKALRPFLDRPWARFIALLEMPSGIDSVFYQHAASELLEHRTHYDEFGNDLVFVARLDEIAIVNSLRRIFEARRVVLLCTDLEALDRDVKLVADVEVVLEGPTPDHFLAAARASGMKGMTRDDAEYLARIDFDKVKMAVNGYRPVRSSISRLRRAAATKLLKAADEPLTRPEAKRTLHDMAGYGEAAEWGLRVAEDVAAWRAGNIDWEDIDRGVVLYGPPGTGKTTFGRALAATCGISIVEASSAKWQAMGHLGDMLRAMRDAFDMAHQKAPCILFLDEIDAFGNRGSGASGDSRDYKRQVINGLLECLDPPGGRPGVIVVGATNLPDEIDPALLRPGRLERMIRVPMPNADDRVAILRQHLRGIEPPAELRHFKEMTEGCAGASIELVAREARRRARKSQHPLTEEDLIASLPPSRPLSETELQRVAIHEAGHAIVGALASASDVLWVVISKRVSLGESAASWGRVEYRTRPDVFQTEESMESSIDFHLAGIAAEKVIFGHHSTSGGGATASDLHTATDLATRMERHFGFGDTLVFDQGVGTKALEGLRESDQRLRQAVDLRLKASLERARAVLEGHRAELEEIAGRLVRSGRVSGMEVLELIERRRASTDGDSRLRKPSDVKSGGIGS